MIINTKLELARDFVNNTDRNIFLTGKAGTGKTTFLHKLKNESLKRIVVVAPTGVAAINAKGVTIHSFFQLPFGPILPHSNSSPGNSFSKKFNTTKITIIKSMDLLIIDEISMVRADVLDGIDQVLKRYRDRTRPFGGVQLLMIGDLQQLSPVIRDEEWQLLKDYYSTGFFFGSKAFMECNALTIELTHIYRQESRHFIKILNEIRNNSLSFESSQVLNKRYQPDFASSQTDGFITLTTHNYRADTLNNRELESLKGKLYSYEAKVDGKFPDYMFPTHSQLKFKVGAQVMFIKNDSSQEKRYFNGKIGKIIRLNKNEIVIRCPKDNFDITTTPEIWENINYTIDNETKAISENKIGEFIQMPLRLAWAITIHKSQGLTFDKIVVDAQDAFAHGQTYVALSRCRTLEGIVLTTPISDKSIICNEEVISFNKNAEQNQPDATILNDSQRNYQLDLLNDLFSFYSFLNPIARITDIYYKNPSSIRGNLIEKLNHIKENGVTELLKINAKFQRQIGNLTSSCLPENDPIFQERFKKAISYFENHTIDFIQNVFKQIEFTTDNKGLTADIEKQIDSLETLLAIKMYCFQGLRQGFKTSEYLSLRAKASIQEKESASPKKREALKSTEHPKLFEELILLRNELSEDEDVAPYQIFTQKALYEMCEYLPITLNELGGISDIGKIRLLKYGNYILKIIRLYRKSIEGKTKSILEKVSQKSDTEQVSYDFFRNGKTIQDIAKERKLTTGTIEGHLMSYLTTGEIKITELMPENKYLELKQIMETVSFDSFGDLKSKIDEKFTYAELRMLNRISNQKNKKIN